MRNTIITAVLLLVAVVVASIFYFGNLGQDRRTSVRPLRQIPASTYFIASFVNDGATDNIFKDFEIFEAVMGKKQITQWSSLKHQLLRNPKLSPLINGADIFISFHPLEDEIATLFSISTNETLDQRTLDQTLLTVSDQYAVSTQDTAGIRLYALSQQHLEDSTSASKNGQDTPLYISYIADNFFASYQPDILIQVADKQLDKLDNEQIEFFEQHRNRNSPFSVFVPQENIPSFVAALKRSPPGDFLRQFTNTTGQTVWNINFRQDALMLTGETQLDQDQDQYITLFAGQSKTNQNLYRYFPQNTMLYIEYSFSDSEQWFIDLNEWQTQQETATQLAQQASQIEKDRKGLLADFQASIGNNFALVEQSNSDYLGFFRIQDSVKFQDIVNAIAQKSTDDVFRFRYSNLPYRFFGDGFKAFNRPYFTRIDDIIVMANQQSTVVDYLRRWRRKNLLIATIGFKNHEQIQGNDANVTFFVNRKLADYLVYSQLKNPFRKNFRDKNDHGFDDFYSWSLQLSGNEGHLLSRFNAIYKSKDRLGANEEWAYQMQSSLIKGPYVFEHSDTSQVVLAQEQNHTLHAIHPTGNKLWSAVLSGRIVGEVQQLADRSLLLATDRRRLYRLDTEGHTLKGFSTSMPSEPVAEPTYVNQDQQQLIAIPARNSIMVYDMEGGPAKGWDNVQVDGRILGPILHIDNHLLVSTSFGRVYFFDLEGNQTKEINLPGDVTFVGPLGAVIEENSPVLYQADNTGKVYQIQVDGSSQIVMEDTAWNDDYEIAFENVAGGAATEMIITDGPNLRVYTLGDTLTSVYDYAFTQTIRDAPVFSPTSSGLKQLGISVQGNNLVYLLTENGRLVDGFPVEGLPLFYYGKINYNSNNYLLKTKRDFKIYAYPH
ncbi:MAG: hypothetical protein ACTHZ1_06035 [Sphingobacterium sp.]